MNLSKSKYCKGIQCPKILWLDKNKPDVKDETTNQATLDNGTRVGELAKKIFGNYTNIEFNEDLNQMIDSTSKLLNNKNIIITEASFKFNDNFCSVDILKKTDDSYEIYEVKSSTDINDIYIDDISYQTYILLNLGLNVKKASIIHLNPLYVRKGKLELDKLFKINDVTDKVLSKQSQINNNIIKINELLKQENEPKIDIGTHCIKPYDCPYFKYCTRHLPDKNVFNISKLPFKKKIDLYNKGSYSYEKLLNEDLNEKQKEEIEFELYNKEDKINKKNIKEFLDTLTYPLYFLDFETYQQAIPEYDGIKPYMQIPFQYSLHYIEKEGGKLNHKEFLADADIDPRRKLAESLINDIPLNVCTLAYNMGFEKGVIKNLSELYPDLKEHLLNIYDNIKDLMIPFQNRDYYTKDMHGSYSIKYVLPALFPNDPSLNYQNLEMIHRGTEAMEGYASLGKLSKEEQEKLRYHLLKYCELDTFAMVKIYERLKETV